VVNQSLQVPAISIEEENGVSGGRCRFFPTTFFEARGRFPPLVDRKT
jgi:hypothetical protein